MSHDFPTSKHETRIEDVPPKRNRDFADLLHALFAVLVGAAVILFSIYLHGTTSGVESDVRSAGHVVSWLMDVPTSLLQQIAIVFITVSVLIQLLIAKEWLQSVVSAIALILGFAAIWGISALISGSGNGTLIMSMMSNGTSVGTGLLPDFYAAMASFLTVAGPRRTRSGTKWGWNILYTVAVLFVVLSWNSLSGVLVSFAAGRALGMLIRFMLGTQTNGAWGNQVAQALRSIGIDVASLSRRLATYTDSGMLKTTLDDDLTENSRIYDAIDVDGHQYTVSVLDNQVHMAGYLNQLWQWVRLTGVSMRRDRSSFDAIHHHYAMILGLQNAGLTMPGVYGVADSSESSILVFHRDHMPLECNPSTMSDHDMELFMTYLSEAHRHGFTHRRITPETLSRMENGQPVIAGWQNGDYGSAPPNYALDKVQLLVSARSVERHRPCDRMRPQDVGRRATDRSGAIHPEGGGSGGDTRPVHLRQAHAQHAAFPYRGSGSAGGRGFHGNGHAVAVQFPFLHRDRAAGRRRVCGVHPDSTGRNDQGGRKRPTSPWLWYACCSDCWLGSDRP